MKLHMLGLALCVSACAANVDGATSDAEALVPDVGVTTEAILNGTIVSSKKGVLWLQTATGTCTGVMIGPFHALTAAHCTALKGSGRSEALATEPMTIWYFASGGRRKVTSDKGGVWTAVIPTWDEINNPGQFDFQDDLGILFYPPGWSGTTTADYVDIYTGSLVNQPSSEFFGAGPDPNNTSNSSAGVLRKMAITLADARQYYFYDLGGSRRICHGDSGGPYYRDIGGQPAVYGVFNVADGLKTGTCASSGGKQYGARLNSRMTWIDGWINADTGGHCVPQSSGVTSRCF